MRKEHDLFNKRIDINASDDTKTDAPSTVKRHLYELVITCKDEKELREYYEKFKGEYKCRILIL